MHSKIVIHEFMIETRERSIETKSNGTACAAVNQMSVVPIKTLSTFQNNLAHSWFTIAHPLPPLRIFRFCPKFSTFWKAATCFKYYNKFSKPELIE
jgi:hypothetical protein